MAKKVETTETVEEGLFEGFKFLNDNVPKSTNKKKEEVKLDDNEEELSLEDLEALKEQEKIISKSKKKQEVEEVLETKEEEKSNEFAGFAKFLAEEGVVDLEEEDKFESEKDLAKVVGRTIKKGIEEYKSSKSEDIQKFLDFVDNGGRPSDFHKYYYGEASFEDFNITSEENKKYVIKEALMLEDYTAEEADAELVDLEDLGKLDKKAEMFLKKLQKVEKNQKELLLETQKTYAKEQESIRIKEWDDFKKGLFDKETIAGFKMSPKMKEDTWNYMTKPIDRKTGETQYQKDSKENADARYLFAYLLKNKWDIKALEKQVETKQVSKLKDKLSNYSDTSKKLKAPANRETIEENDNPFSAFKKVLG